MNLDELEQHLRLWGHTYGERAADVAAEPPEDVRAPDVHPIARGMRFAPGRAVTVIRQRTTMDRGGQQRRRLMARELGACGVAIVPADFVDPVPGSRSSRGYVGRPPLQVSQQAPAERVQSEWLRMYRVDELRALVVQKEYQLRAMKQAEKAELLSIGVKRYRDELRDGKIWLHARLSA